MFTGFAVTHSAHPASTWPVSRLKSEKHVIIQNTKVICSFQLRRSIKTDTIQLAFIFIFNKIHIRKYFLADFDRSENGQNWWPSLFTWYFRDSSFRHLTRSDHLWFVAKPYFFLSRFSIRKCLCSENIHKHIFENILQKIMLRHFTSLV